MVEDDRQAYLDAIEELKAQWSEYRQRDAPLFDSKESAIRAVTVDGRRAALFTHMVTLYEHALQTVDRTIGGTLVGIHLPTYYNDVPATVDVRIGGMPLSRLSMSPGDKCLALEDATCLHMEALQYHEVHLSGEDVELTLIYCIFDLPVITYIGQSVHVYLVPEGLRSTHTKKYPDIRFRAGMGGSYRGDEGTVNAAVASGYSRMLDIWKVHKPISCRVRGRKIIERVGTLKEELMAAAWHPTRMARWCWDIGEQEAFPSLCATSQQKPSRVWWDEVLVVDGGDASAVFMTQTTLLSLPEGDSVCFVSSTGRGFVTVRGKANRYVCFDAAKPYWRWTGCVPVGPCCTHYGECCSVHTKTRSTGGIAPLGV